MKERIAYFDFLRGLAIMMVVGIHTYTLGEDSTAIRQLLNTAVPLFIAISGYFLSQKKMENKGDYLSFLKKQLPKVYLPVLAWSLPFYALALFSGSSIIKQTILLLGCGISIYYFVAFIMQCYVFLPVINICISGNKRMGGVIISCLISLVWIAGVVYMSTMQGRGIPLILYAGPLPCWLMFFVLGVVIGHKPERDYSIILPIVITILGLMLSVIESEYLLDHYGKGVGIKPSSFICRKIGDKDIISFSIFSVTMRFACLIADDTMIISLFEYKRAIATAKIPHVKVLDKPLLHIAQKVWLLPIKNNIIC